MQWYKMSLYVLFFIIAYNRWSSIFMSKALEKLLLVRNHCTVTLEEDLKQQTNRQLLTHTNTHKHSIVVDVDESSLSLLLFPEIHGGMRNNQNPRQFDTVNRLLCIPTWGAHPIILKYSLSLSKVPRISDTEKVEKRPLSLRSRD